MIVERKRSAMKKMRDAKEQEGLLSPKRGNLTTIWHTSTKLPKIEQSTIANVLK